VVFGVLQITGGHDQEIACDRRVHLGDVLETGAPREANGGLDDRFGGETVRGTVFQAEDVANQVKCANLSPAVREELVAPHRTLDHLIDIFRRFCLPEDFRAPIVSKFAQNDLRSGKSVEFAARFGPVGRIRVDVDKHG